MVLQINDLVKSFQQPGGGKLTVLDIESLEVDAGQQVALIGQSGGGKTTLLHLIAGLLTPDSGSIRINGTELTRLSEQGRAILFTLLKSPLRPLSVWGFPSPSLRVI